MVELPIDLRLIRPEDVLFHIGELVRASRQREGLTQSELASKAGVPATTISRLERTGLAATDSLLKVMFALDQIDAFEAFLKERVRLAHFPKSLDQTANKSRTVLRVRHRKADR